MNFLDKLDYLMSKSNLNKRTLSQQSGVPYTTILDFYKKGYEHTRISTIFKLATFLGVTTDYLIDDDITDENYGLQNRTAPVKTTDAASEKLLFNFSALNEDGRSVLLEVSDAMVESRRYVRRERRFAAADGHEAQPNDVSAEELDNLLGEEPTYDV